MKLKHFLLLLLVVPLVGASCHDNESTVHAKKTVEILQKMNVQAESGVPMFQVLGSLVEAKMEFRKVDAKDISHEAYFNLAQSINTYDNVAQSLDLESVSREKRSAWWASASDDLNAAAVALNMKN